MNVKINIIFEKVENMTDRVGVIKEIDKLGRIVIPKEMRERLALEENVEVILTDDGVLIRNPEYRLVKVLPTDDVQ